MEQKSGTRSVDRMLDILECFDERGGALGVHEISAKTALASATVYRIAQTLAARGYLKQNAATKKYEIGPRFLPLAKLFLQRLELLEIARPHIEALRTRINETVKLYIWSGGDRMCIAIAKSAHRLQSQTVIGDEFSLSKGAAGKVILAHAGLTDDSVENAELERIRRLGYAVGHGERVNGISSIGVPIFNHRGQVVGSFAVAGPTVRFARMDLTETIAAAMQTGKAISCDLGFSAR